MAMHITTKQKTTLVISSIFVIGLVISLYLLSKSQDIRQRADSSLTCSNAPDQICSQQACQGNHTGSGSCSPGSNCCKIPLQATTDNNTVLFISDIPSLKLSRLNLLPIVTVVNGLYLLGNPSVTYYDQNGKQSTGSQIAQIVFRITDIAQVPLQNRYLLIPNGNTNQTLAAYGNVYNPADKSLTIFLYYNDAQLQRMTTSDLAMQTWQTALRTLYEVVHPLPPVSQSQLDAFNIFITNNSSTIPFTLSK